MRSTSEAKTHKMHWMGHSIFQLMKNVSHKSLLKGHIAVIWLAVQFRNESFHIIRPNLGKARARTDPDLPDLVIMKQTNITN